MAMLTVIRDIWLRYRRRRANAKELGRLDICDQRRIMEETGLSLAELTALAEGDSRGAALLFSRMSQLGLNAANAGAGNLQDMQRCCSLCDNKMLCEHELEDKPQVAIWPRYCSNKYILEALRDTILK